MRLGSTSWADIVDEEDEDLLGHLAREAMHLPYSEQLMSLLDVTWEDPAPPSMVEEPVPEAEPAAAAAAAEAPEAAAAPAGMEPAPESETVPRDCESLIKAFVQCAGRGVE